MNKKMLISIVCILLVTAMVVGAVILAVTNDHGADQPRSADTTTESPTVPTEQPETTNNEYTTEKEILPEPNEDWFVSQLVPELNEGNEIYLDADVIGKLAMMDENGEEDRVNAILDGEILLINYFAEAGYTAKAICQIQRFYYAFYEVLKNEVFKTLVENITVCVDPEGACPYVFPSDVYETFGWGENTDFTYVFEMEIFE